MMDSFEVYVKMNEEHSSRKKEKDALEKEEQEELFDSLNQTIIDLDELQKDL